MPDARHIRGLLKSPHAAPLTVEQMDEAVAKQLRNRSAFDQDKDAQLIAVRSLLQETAFAFEDREAVAGAVAPRTSAFVAFAGDACRKITSKVTGLTIEQNR